MKLPIVLSSGPGTSFQGALQAELEPFYSSPDWIRRVERASIRTWMEQQREYLRGRVLDFGAGEQPYRDLVDGEYVAVDKGVRCRHLFRTFDAVMCNQVVQYLVEPVDTIRWQMLTRLRSGGHLVMTYPTNWDEVEEDDYWRFTRRGMERLLTVQLGMQIVKHELRAAVQIGNFRFPLGYGLVAVKQ